MRLNKSSVALATQELLEMLRYHPEGLRTSEFNGTRSFHGVRTLSSYQVIKLLRASGRAEGRMEGGGKFWAMRWKLVSK
jgi:hypothetical protein